MKQIRIAILGKYTTYPSYFNIGVLEGAIRCGCSAFPIPLLPQSDLTYLKNQIDFYKPDILLCHCIFDKKPWNRDDLFQILRDTRKKWGTKIVYHCGDARKKPRFPHNISDICDLGLVNHAEHKGFSELWKIPAIHWPYGCMYQKDIADKQDRFKADIVFTGSLDFGEHHKQRKEFLKQLSKRIQIKTYPDKKYGNSMFITPVVSSSAKGILGTQMGSDIDLYLDVRPFQYIGAGAIYFHENHKNIQSFFRDYIHYVPYELGNVDVFIRKFNQFNDKKCIREKGFEFCQKYHSTKERLRMILDFFDGKKLQNIYLD